MIARTTKVAFLLLALAASGLGCKAAKQRKAAYAEAKDVLGQMERQLGQQIMTTGTFCPSAKALVPPQAPVGLVPVPAGAWNDEAWKCLKVTREQVWCQYGYQSNGKSDDQAEATLTGLCDPNADGKPLKFEVKLKGTLTGDAERVSISQPPPQ